MDGPSDPFIDQVPNPSKVLVILEELGVPYKSSLVEPEDLKKKPFTDINPNGRLPGTFYNTQSLSVAHSQGLILLVTLAAIKDPNYNDIILFESGAIVIYLISKYDRSNALTYTDSPKVFELLQWSYFQASGQGPYFGQAAWYTPFKLPHPIMITLLIKSHFF